MYISLYIGMYEKVNIIIANIFIEFIYQPG